MTASPHHRTPRYARIEIFFAASWIGAIVAGSTTTPLLAVSPTVRVEQIDGTELGVKWKGVGDGDRLQFLQDGRAIELPWDQISEVSFQPVASIGASGKARVHLPDDGRLTGSLLEGAADSIVLQRIDSNPLTIPFSQASGVEFLRISSSPQAQRMYLSALQERLAAQDSLVFLENDDARIVRGRIDRLGSEHGSFVISDRARSFPTEKIHGIVFAVGVSAKVSPRSCVQFTNGDRLPCELRGDSAGDAIRVRTTFADEISIPLSSVASLQFRSDRVVYLSDISAKAQEIEGRLHAPWPVRMNRNVADGPLRIAGRTFSKGIGVHSRTALTYALRNDFESFAALVGLDDLVGDRGSAVFRVVGDGKTLWESPLLTGRDAPLAVFVSVDGLIELTLEVDYGDELDLSDYANWAQARLIRRNATKPSPS